MNPPILTAENVEIRFGGLVALSEVSFQMEQGSIMAIIGPNGAGKTTLFNCITGFYQPTEGNIYFNDGKRSVRIAHPPEDKYRTLIITGIGLAGFLALLWIFGLSVLSFFVFGALMLFGIVVLQVTASSSMPIHKIAQLGVSRTYQNIRLFDKMTGLENLLVAQHNTVNHHLLSGIFKTGGFRRSEKEALDKAWYWLEFMGLEETANQEAGNLPYGMQRRLELARAMATSPQLICLDEPAAGLNRQETEVLNAVIVKLRDKHNISILLIEHHMGVVMNISDQVVVLDHGVVISQGTPEQVRKDPKVITAYLGEEDVDAALAQAGSR